MRDPFSDEGIGLAERAFLDAFADRRAMDADQALMFRFVKYLGQAYVEKLECRWAWQPMTRPGHGGGTDEGFSALVPVSRAAGGQHPG